MWPSESIAFSVLKAFGYHKELEPVLSELLQPLGGQGSPQRGSDLGTIPLLPPAIGR